MYQKLDWDYDIPLNPDNLNHMDEGIYNNSFNIDKIPVIKYSTITGTPNGGGALKQGQTTSNVIILHAHILSNTDGYVIPYANLGVRWYFAVKTVADNKPITEEVTIGYIYIDKDSVM